MATLAPGMHKILNLKFTRNMKDDPAAVNTHAMRHRGFLCEIYRNGQYDDSFWFRDVILL